MCPPEKFLGMQNTYFVAFVQSSELPPFPLVKEKILSPNGDGAETGLNAPCLGKYPRLLK